MKKCKFRSVLLALVLALSLDPELWQKTPRRSRSPP